MDTLNIFNFDWDWTDFCPTGLEPFSKDSNDLLVCFQEIALRLPIYTIYAAISAYYFGFTARVVVRNDTQLFCLNWRFLVALISALLPVWKIFVFHHNNVPISAADVLVVATECVMWMVHCGYLLSMRNIGNMSHRGPLTMNVFWLMIFVLDIVALHSSLSFSWWPWSLLSVLLDICYAVTLAPKGSAVFLPMGLQRHSEDQSLLANRYTYFRFDFNEAHLGHAQDGASCWSRLFFNWVEPLIVKGVGGALKKIEDLFDLPDSLNVTRLSENIQRFVAQKKSLFWVLHSAYGKEFYLIGILRFVADIAGFAGPLLLGGLLSQEGSVVEATDGTKRTNFKPYYYALGLFGTTLISAMLGTHFFWRMSLVGMKMRTGVVSAIYRKALEARGLKDARPEILNLMSTDTDRIVNSCLSFHSFWNIPFQLVVTLYLLYTQLGAAFIAGVTFAITLIPINRWLATRIGHYSRGLMTAKDARLTATSEAMKGAKQIKLHAWEDVFVAKISALRQDEVKFLAKRKYLDALCVYFWATTPVLMCFLTFGVLVWLGQALNAANTYTSVALLNMLIGPLNAFPWVLNGLIESWISLKRVQELMDLPDLDLATYYDPVVQTSAVLVDTEQKPIVLQLKGASFAHDASKLVVGEDTPNFRLDGLNLCVQRGELICIEGPVGGGKSTLMAAIVGGIDRVEGSICVQDLIAGFGYVPQTPWLQRGTIRDNIVWGATYDETWYKSVLYACALNEDLVALGGDLVSVGENGHALSGGQCARVALARAVYQDKKVYLMDDILAALDAHVSRHIIKHCLLGLLKDRTRIIITRSSALFMHANYIMHMENGSLTGSDLMSDSMDLSLDGSDDEAGQSDERKASIDLDELRTAHEKLQQSDAAVQDESREYGNLSLRVLACYWKAVSTPVSVLVLLAVILMQLSRNLSDAWLAHWVTDTTHDANKNASGLLHLVQLRGADGNDTQPPHTTAYYLGIFGALTATNSVLTLARAFLFAFGGIKAARFIHDRLLNKVMYTKFSFFDTTGVGRILNRFSSDTYTVDDSLPFMLNILLAQLVGLVGALIVSIYAMPWLTLVVIPIVPVYLSLQHRYRHASRDIKRLSSNALSPLYTHFTETLQGLVTIRSMRASGRFQRDFHGKLEESLKATLTAAAAQKWLALRLQLLGSVLVGGAGLLAAITSAHSTNPGLVGLAISYALSITSLLGGVLNSLAETEQELIAVERVDQYMQLDGEDNAEGSQEAPFGWPSQGALSFKNVNLRYRDDQATAALHDINFTTEAFERIAIVGRTGAGKTSIVSALMRVLPLNRGNISVDCVNLKTLALRTLRERIGIIPQEPFLFEGTVRDNLDPRHSYHDSEIWHAITNCATATLLVQSLGGLDGRLEQGAINLSAGQKQLLCLARILLRNSKVVSIDEGTSNLDDESEMAMHQALRTCFKSSTVLFIAHRLKGLERMDRIIVMDQGAIKEQGTPSELAHDEQSLFHAMLLAQNINVADFY